MYKYIASHVVMFIELAVICLNVNMYLMYIHIMLVNIGTDGFMKQTSR
jgi:hypothetical protein